MAMTSTRAPKEEKSNLIDFEYDIKEIPEIIHIHPYHSIVFPIAIALNFLRKILSFSVIRISNKLMTLGKQSTL